MSVDSKSREMKKAIATAQEKEKTRYSDEELDEFREIILEKLEKATMI